MAYRNFDEFLIRLEQADEVDDLHLSQHAELGIMHHIRNQGQAGERVLRFDLGAGYAFPLVANLFGTRQRMEWALNVSTLDAVEHRFSSLLQMDGYSSFSQLMAKAGEVMNAVRSSGLGVTKTDAHPEVQQVVIGNQPDVSIIPIPYCWPQEPYPSLPSAQLYFAEQNQEQRTCSTRIIMYDDQRLGVHLPRNITGDNERIPAAVVLGGDPALVWTSLVPLPPVIKPQWIAGWLRNRAVPMTQSISQPSLFIPANAEIVIEGWINPREQQRCGPFVGNDGFYLKDEAFFTMNVTAITYRKDAFIPFVHPVYPSAEQRWINRATEHLIVPPLQMLAPELVDLTFPPEGAGTNLAVVSINKQTDDQIHRLIHSLWGIGATSQVKTLIVVDDDVDIRDPDDVLDHVLTHTSWRHDLLLTDGPLHDHNHTTLRHGFGGKLCIDATRKQRPVDAPEPVSIAELTPLLGEQTVLVADSIVISAVDANQDDLDALIDSVWQLQPQANLVLVDDDVDPRQFAIVAWYLLSSVDWRRDLIVRGGLLSPYQEANDRGAFAVKALRRIHDWPQAAITTSEMNSSH
jgi:4-hydroxy-3-polyprenylbenzoate decarboxylase